MSFAKHNHARIRDYILKTMKKALKYINYQKPFFYTPMEDIAHDTGEWLKNIPSNFDCVIGIPRSGLIVASMIATIFGKPLSTPEQFISGVLWKSSLGDHQDNQYNSVFLIDDSIGTGKQLLKNKELIQSAFPDLKIITGALYVTNTHKGIVDYYFKLISNHHAHSFEFNILHTKPPGSVFSDLDGVLCLDGNIPEGDLRYELSLKTALPYKIPLYNIDCVLTARKEKYRELTENWLRSHGVKYTKLIMLAGGDAIIFKCNFLISEKPYLYLESNPELAKTYHSYSGTRILCVGNGVMFERDWFL